MSSITFLFVLSGPAVAIAGLARFGKVIKSIKKKAVNDIAKKGFHCRSFLQKYPKYLVLNNFSVLCVKTKRILYPPFLYITIHLFQHSHKIWSESQHTLTSDTLPKLRTFCPNFELCSMSKASIIYVQFLCQQSSEVRAYVRSQGMLAYQRGGGGHPYP